MWESGFPKSSAHGDPVTHHSPRLEVRAVRVRLCEGELAERLNDVSPLQHLALCERKAITQPANCSDVTNSGKEEESARPRRALAHAK